ncbi:fatty acid oxidation complex subunit alpha FadJ [Vibrio sp.]|nr:fatty acid oxidation complex subunit alpha FadJ [Vibrio sp.]
MKIAWLTMDVPGESMNTLKSSFVDDFTQILTILRENASTLKGLVIQSGKVDNFIAGADVRMLDACQSAEEAQALATKGQHIFSQIEELPFPVVSAIHGACLGGGLELALACDYRVATDHDKTKIGLPEVQLGLLPGSGGTQRLPRLIGLLPSLEMILTGKQQRAKKAKKLNIVDEVVPQAVLSRAAKEQLEKGKREYQPVKELVSKTALSRNFIFSQAEKKAFEKSRGNYPAIDSILAVIKHGLDHGMAAGLEREAMEFGQLVMSSQSKALRGLFFATTEMKKESQASLAKPLKKVAVLGGGLMGAGIGYVTLAKAKYPVRIKDVSPDGVLNAHRYSFKLLEKLRKRRVLKPAQVKSMMHSLSGSVEYRNFANIDMVIEAVFEDVNLKQSMVVDIENHCHSEVIFATNTSSIPIHQIAEKAKHPENIIGLHYFSPVEKMPLVEIIPHVGTSDKVIATTLELAKKQGKTAIVVKDSAGFYVNRILAPYMNESIKCLLDGEPVEHIDEALLNDGFPVGPLTLLDEVGVDIGAKITPILVNELGERFKAPDNIFEQLLKDERKGRKSNKGFYLYQTSKVDLFNVLPGKRNKSKQVDKSVYTLLNVTPKSALSQKDIAMRCLLPMLNEAVRCLDDGVIASARDGDIGAIFGIGFPPFTGGPFRLMDAMGIEQVVSEMEKHSVKYGRHFAPCDGLLRRAQSQESFY